MTVKMPITTRAVVTETYSDSSDDDDEEFSSPQDDTQLAHAVDDPVESSKPDSSDADESEEDNNEVESTQENSDSESMEDADEDDSDAENANTGWADSIAKILNTSKPKKKKTLVLSRAKRLNDAPKRAKAKSAGYEVEKDGGVITEETITEEKNEQNSTKIPKTKKKEILSLRVKPNVLNKDRERLLSKIATKGVVQLFNSVKGQQKEIKTKLASVGPLEVKRDKVLKSIDKRSFLDHLMGDKAKSVSVGTEHTSAGSSDKATWNVLRDDFMMGSNKMKDWDKNLEMEDEEETEKMEVEQEVELESD